MTYKKAELRRILKDRRTAFVAAISDVERTLCFTQAPAPLSALIDRATVVAGYVATRDEPDPAPLLTIAAERGKVVALPRSHTRATPMEFVARRQGQAMAIGPWGVPQPAGNGPGIIPDLVLVPLVGFDRRGMRLGQGAGCYDRALARLHGATAVGIAWSVQEVAAVPTDPWDMPLDAILTERAWITP